MINSFVLIVPDTIFEIIYLLLPFPHVYFAILNWHSTVSFDQFYPLCALKMTAQGQINHDEVALGPWGLP
jgi:hypothetical protein